MCLSHDGEPQCVLATGTIMDATTRSEDFTHLSVRDLNAPSLARVSRERDLFTNDDHKPLDAELMETFSLYRRLDEEPNLDSLLVNITVGDDRLVSLTPSKAKDLLKRQPSLNAVLQKAWKEASFKEVRQLGAVVC